MPAPGTGRGRGGHWIRHRPGVRHRPGIGIGIGIGIRAGVRSGDCTFDVDIETTLQELRNCKRGEDA